MSDIPTRIAIGTQKAASTYLYNLLSSHSAVALSEHTEVNFYSAHFEKGLTWYTDSFPKTGTRIDISPKYFMQGGTVAERIKATIGSEKPKLLLILRNPIDYLTSHFLMQQQQGFFKAHPQYQNAPPDLATFITHYPEYATRAQYHACLTHDWLTQFPLDCFKIVFFEELTAPKTASTVLAEIQTFWDLPIESLTASEASKNRALRSPLVHRAKNFVVRHPKLKDWLKQQSWFSYAYRRVLTKQSTAALSPEVRSQLAEQFQTDVAQLETLLGRSTPWPDFHNHPSD